MIEALKPFLEGELIPGLSNLSLIIVGILSIGLYFLVLRMLRRHREGKNEDVSYRGTLSERALLLKLIRSGASEDSIFHDLYVRKDDGTFSQIDLVMVTEVGILVIEVKDYSGWIFGNGNHSHWTKVMAYGKKKYRFYNPIKQNLNHIEVLRKQSDHFNGIPFYNIIVFYGNCELKEINYIPRGTYILKAKRIFEVIDVIKRDNESAYYGDKQEVIRVLQQAVENGASVEAQIQHNENIKDLLGEHRVFG